jgi:hypothetical protein
MKNFFRMNVYLLLAVVFLLSLTLPHDMVSAHSSKTQIHLHIKNSSLDKTAKVTLVYKEKVKKKGKDEYKERTISFSRYNSTLYKAYKPNGFYATKNVTFNVKEGNTAQTYKPSKVTGNKGTVNYWITLSKPDDKKEDKPSQPSFTHNEALIPLVTDVYSNGDGTYTVYWGYDNQNDISVNALSSRFSNVVYVYNNATPQNQEFTEGKVEAAFKTVFAGSSITWELTGPDGVNRKVTASASNAKAYKSVYPLLRGVYKNVNNTYTAYWGYHNENTVTVDAKTSQFFHHTIDGTQPHKTNLKAGLVLEAFKTNFASTELTWNVTGPNGFNASATAMAANAKSYLGVIPSVKAVYDNGDGSFTAYFGYQNLNDVSVDALESKFTSGTVINNQAPWKHNFVPGTNEEAFTATFKGTHVTWELTAPDGQKRTITALSTNALKYNGLVPTVNKVVNNGDGTFTAVWGYMNLNNVNVSVSSSVLKGNILKGEIALKESFKAGIQTNVCQTTFKGTELTWEVKGPDGVTRTVTAYTKDAVAK